jgi:hypothetical protein
MNQTEARQKPELPGWARRGRRRRSLEPGNQVGREHDHEDQRDGEQRKVATAHVLGPARSGVDQPRVGLGKILVNPSRAGRSRPFGRGALGFFALPKIILVDRLGAR